MVMAFRSTLKQLFNVNHAAMGFELADSLNLDLVSKERKLSNKFDGATTFSIRLCMMILSNTPVGLAEWINHVKCAGGLIEQHKRLTHQHAATECLQKIASIRYIN